MSAQSKKIFLTGATGGIGSHVSKTLLDLGFEVAGLVRPESASKLSKGVTPLFGSLEDVESFSAAFLELRPDMVLHLGWIGVDKTAKSDPSQIQNLKATVDLLKLCTEAGTKTFLGMGSEAEYGPHHKKIDESAATLPQTNYAIAKLAAGLTAHKICNDQVIQFVWLRLFSSYGPGDRPGSLMSLLIKTLIDKKTMPLSGCEQVWDYVHVKDIARLIGIIAQNPKEGGFFNLGGGHAQPIKNVILQIAEAIDPNADLRFGEIPYGKNQNMHLEADISKLKAVYGWEPQVSLEDGLKETIAFHRS